MSEELSAREGNRCSLVTEGDRIQEELLRAVDSGERLTIVKAPPGSGKTYLMLRGVERARMQELRVAVATQTNAQANDACRRLASDYPHIRIHRFGRAAEPGYGLGASVTWITNKHQLPAGPCVVVSTVAKWGVTQDLEPYDVLFVDEAWQMAWSDFMLCGQISARFILIGDPGQIPPVVTIPVERWETAPRAPHHPAPQLIADDPTIPTRALMLPASRRLPFDTVKFVLPLYDFSFGALARPGERVVEVAPPTHRDHPADEALDLLAGGSVSTLVIPTPEEGPPFHLDKQLAAQVAGVVVRLLDRGAMAVDSDDGERLPLVPRDIGVVATHRILNNQIRLCLPSAYRDQVTIDTPERWQGIERKVMVAVHPLSGVTSPSAFDVETGRLCVMISRHRSGLIIVSRDHVRHTLETHIPFAEQSVGRPDIAGRGHSANLAFWESVERDNRLVRAA